MAADIENALIAGRGNQESCLRIFFGSLVMAIKRKNKAKPN